MPSRSDLLSLLHHVRGRLDGNLSLEALAARSGWSSFHLHRAFRRLVGETPKAYTQRLRLDRAAARLAASTDRVVDVALDSGFASHEVFTRAFTRRFGRSPERYRAAARSVGHSRGPGAPRRDHRGSGPVPHALSPVDRPSSPPRSSFMATPTIERKDLQPQPALVVSAASPRARESRRHLPRASARRSLNALQNGLALAGRPVQPLPGRLAGPDDDRVGEPIAAPARGVGDIEAITLPGGPVGLRRAHGRLRPAAGHLRGDRALDGSRACVRPARRGSRYITDPAEHPDPANWRTDVYWPISE